MLGESITIPRNMKSHFHIFHTFKNIRFGELQLQIIHLNGDGGYSHVL